MCGLVGFIDTKNKVTDKQALLSCMVEQLAHRGPDDQGFWIENEVALGHARLAIQDLSQHGHQPMQSSGRRYQTIYNGEVYNAQEMAKELSESHGFNFHGHSDTEVILAAVEAWGVEAALQRCNGMFAIALWDTQENLLFLARDRMGIKPLYYGWLDGSVFGFSSELKPFSRCGRFAKTINKTALAWQLQYAYVPAPLSIYEGINKLEPGQLKVFQLEGQSLKERSSSYFWTAKQAVSQPVFTDSAESLIDQLDTVLRDSVGKRMLSDVPLGAFLSGGIDSSTVVSLMQAQSVTAVKTFSIGFEVPGYNEAEHAKAVARHLQTDHTELYLTAKDALSVVPKLAQMYDEPFADSSQIPTFLVSELAKSKVTVALSGDGGDELFTGYNRYLWAQKIWQYLAMVPRPLRSVLAKGILSLPPACWAKCFSVLPGRHKMSLPADKLVKLARLIDAKDKMALYGRLLAQINPGAELVRGVNPHELMTLQTLSGEHGFVRSMMFNDLIGYMPNDILTKVDRASMAVSLEARVPLLDHNVVEFAAKVPMQYKLREGKSKWLLRQVLYRYVPAELIERPKMGFGVPIDSWLRGELKDWAGDLFANLRAKNSDLINVDFVEQKWQQHVAGKQNWQHFLWNVLMFQSWSDQYQV